MEAIKQQIELFLFGLLDPSSIQEAKEESQWLIYCELTGIRTPLNGEFVKLTFPE